MDKKQSTTTTTTSHPLRMCEELFNAFRQMLRPLRRLTFHHPDSSDPAHQTKLPEPIAPPQVQQNYNPKTEPKLRSEVVPLGTAPQPLPPPKSEKATKEGINMKMDEYITRTRDKIKSTASSVGKVATFK